MPTYAKSIDVTVPVRTAYDQWTQFELFPHFMAGVERVTQTDDTHTHWVTSIAGVHREFDALITEQKPDERVAWRSTSGAEHAGVVTFHRLDDTTTRVHLQLEFSPEDITEAAGAATGAVSQRLQGDLGRFKEFVESREISTGGWRGTVEPSPQRGQNISEQ
jgi:uncharacterized membrane protein